ncbi:host attachment protein [Pseudomonadota bacterium]
MSTAWIIAADTAHARIFSAEQPNGELEEIETLTYPEARLHEGDMVSDSPGRERNASGSGSHDMGHTSDAKQAAAMRFAEQVSGVIEAGRIAGRFNKLYIIAAPAFLGIMRKHYSSATSQSVTAEVDKNLTTHSAIEIRQHLPARL